MHIVRWFTRGLLLLLALQSLGAWGQEWRSEPLSAIDRQYMAGQREALNDLAQRHFGRQLNGDPRNDLPILQRLLDDGVVGQQQVAMLQAMGIVLGDLLKSQHGLQWMVYYDNLGRSKSLQVPGFDKDFIFPVTQISRRAEVGLNVDVAAVYKELEQAIEAIRRKPPF